MIISHPKGKSNVLSHSFTFRHSKSSISQILYSSWIFRISKKKGVTVIIMWKHCFIINYSQVYLWHLPVIEAVSIGAGVTKKKKFHLKHRTHQIYTWRVIRHTDYTYQLTPIKPARLGHFAVIPNLRTRLKRMRSKNVTKEKSMFQLTQSCIVSVFMLLHN